MKVELREQSGPKQCPFCRGVLGSEDVHACASCETEYHADCAREAGRCAVLGCGRAFALAPTCPRCRREVASFEERWRCHVCTAGYHADCGGQVQQCTARGCPGILLPAWDVRRPGDPPPVAAVAPGAAREILCTRCGQPVGAAARSECARGHSFHLSCMEGDQCSICGAETVAQPSVLGYLVLLGLTLSYFFLPGFIVGPALALGIPLIVAVSIWTSVREGRRNQPPAAGSVREALEGILVGVGILLALVTMCLIPVSGAEPGVQRFMIGFGVAAGVIFLRAAINEIRRR